jgi:hypothetical protein
MEKFRGRLALPVARLTRNFPSPTIVRESGGRNRCIQQMAHFVPNRCHTPIKAIVGSQPKVSISGLGEGFNPAWSTHFGSPGRMLKLGDGSVAIIGIRLDTKEDTEQAAEENRSRVQATVVA